MVVKFCLLISRQGKVRLAKWYQPYSLKERARIIKEVQNNVIGRPSKLCNFFEWREDKICYKRYASLYFVLCIDQKENELLAMETIHHFVEVLDRYFGNVCELDLIFNFHKAYFILDEILLSGTLQETSKKGILRVISAQDVLMDNEA